MARPVGSRSRLSREERRESLLDAAAELITTQGIESVTMERVAAEAGVSKALPYVYFDNASDVLGALHDRETCDLDTRVVRALREAPDFETKVRVTLETWLEVVREKGHLMGALLQSQGDKTLERRRAARQRRNEEFWAALVVDEYGLDDQTALVAAGMLLRGSITVLELWLSKRVRRRDLVDTYVRLAMGMLRSVESTEER